MNNSRFNRNIVKLLVVGFILMFVSWSPAEAELKEEVIPPVEESAEEEPDCE